MTLSECPETKMGALLASWLMPIILSCIKGFRPPWTTWSTFQNKTEHKTRISIWKSVFSAVKIIEILAWHKPVIPVPGGIEKGTERLRLARATQ